MKEHAALDCRCDSITYPSGYSGVRPSRPLFGMVFAWTLLSVSIGNLITPPASSFENVDRYQPSGVLIEQVEYEGRAATAVEFESHAFRDWTGILGTIIGLSPDTPNSIALVIDSDFANGTIEVDLYSTIAKKMLGLSRGFAGIAFRVSDDMETYEVVYVRPANGRVESEVRRSHALQYAAHPDFHFDVSRKESPGVYETAADIGLDEWIRLRIEVEGDRASVFVNDESALDVVALKLGADRRGRIALWVGIGTKAYFSNLTVIAK